MFDRLRMVLTRRLEKITGQNQQLPEPLLDPARLESLRKKGNALIADGEYELAEQCFREALEHQADDTKLLVCLGYVLKEQSRFAEARGALRRAAGPGNADTDAAEASYLLAEISELQADPEDAKRQLAKALNLKPDFTRACADLIRLLEQTGQEVAARELLVRSVNLCPDCVDYRLWLARAFSDEFDYPAMVDQLTSVVKLGDADARVHLTIGAALVRLDRYVDAQQHFDQAKALDPTIAHEIFYHQGYFQSLIGNSAEAIELLEASIKLQPDHLASHQMLLFNLCFAQPRVSGRYKQAALRFNQTVRPKKRFEIAFTPPVISAAKRPLRIGFSCAEFRNHPVYYFLYGVLAQIDRSRFQLFAYSNNEINDHVTTVLKEEMDEWHDIRDMPDDEAAELIRSHHVDVLIDLCGHSGDGRLPVFARRPAPIQVAWLGYFASTGLDEMDFIIGDPMSVPEDSAEWFSETVVRLPSTRLCMTKPQPSRDILLAQPPCVTRGYITFGSFQQAAKITPSVLRLWSQVLAQVPNSRLRIQSSAFSHTTVRERVSASMRALEIDLARVEMSGSLGLEDYLESHNQVDMLIDTFPYTGGTTTAFALWMGVPIVSLLGDTMLSRQGATMLSCVGLSDWIAADESDYIEKAVRFSADVPSLVQLRARLREETEKSPLFDTENFTRNFENALVNMHAQRKVTMEPADNLSTHYTSPSL